MPKPTDASHLELVERLQVAYNHIDRHLRGLLKKPPNESFSTVVTEYARSHPRWNGRELLLAVGRLRNVIVHERLQSHEYLAIPTERVVEQVERVCRELTQPERVIPQFKRDVLALAADDSVADILKIIARHDYSQFPVYDAESFVGLLTENGLTHWLAKEMTRAEDFPLVCLSDHTAREVLAAEPPASTNYQFVGRDAPVQDVREMFSNNIFLEVVLVTHNGKPSEALLGIMSRWDAL